MKTLPSKKFLTSVAVFAIVLSGLVVWWLLRPPNLVAIADAIGQSYANGDIDTIYRYMPEEEKENLSKEQLSSIYASVFKQQFMNLSVSKDPNIGRILESNTGLRAVVSFLYKSGIGIEFGIPIVVTLENGRAVCGFSDTLLRFVRQYATRKLGSPHEIAYSRGIEALKNEFQNARVDKLYNMHTGAWVPLKTIQQWSAPRAERVASGGFGSSD